MMVMPVMVLTVPTSMNVPLLHVTAMQLVTILTVVTLVHVTTDMLEMVTNANVLMTMLSGMVTAISVTVVTKEPDSTAKISTNAPVAVTHVTPMLPVKIPMAVTTVIATLDIAVIFSLFYLINFIILLITFYINLLLIIFVILFICLFHFYSFLTG